MTEKEFLTLPYHKRVDVIKDIYGVKAPFMGSGFMQGLELIESKLHGGLLRLSTGDGDSTDVNILPRGLPEDELELTHVSLDLPFHENIALAFWLAFMKSEGKLTDN